MLWADILLALTSIYASVKLGGHAKKHGGFKFTILAAAAFLFFLMQLSLVVSHLSASPVAEHISSLMFEWGNIVCMALVLSSLAIFIRDSKPVFAQFPMLYTALPLLIVISYILVQDTYELKIWLLSIYQGGAILVALLMYTVYAYRKSDYILNVVGMVCFLLSYMLYWLSPLTTNFYPWIWQLLLGTGILCITWGYDKSAVQNESL